MSVIIKFIKYNTGPVVSLQKIAGDKNPFTFGPDRVRLLMVLKQEPYFLEKLSKWEVVPGELY